MARALAKNPTERPPSCREFVFDLAVELGLDMSELGREEASAHVVVASDDPSTRAIVRASLVNMGIAVAEVGAGDRPSWLAERRFDAVVADVAFGSDELAALRDDLQRGADVPAPKLLLIVPRGANARDAVERAGADAELGQPFSGMQLAMRMRRLLGDRAVRV
jgi:DNA-binding response OmpR family regulator